MLQTRLTGILAACPLMLLVAACAPAMAPTASGGVDIAASAPGMARCRPTTSDEQRSGAEATNTIRARSGLPSVAPNDTLSQAAARHACDMAERGRMTHVGSQSRGPAQRVKALGYRPQVTAENIAAGPFDLDNVLAAWNASSGHTANMLIPQLREFGIGQAVGSDGRTRYWAAVYAAPAGR
ncbi:CAP domain-containing protein [Paracoccus liaowanqingii]|nr:CAP domain-containing protein [Paracoccus liaowanqingii]